MENDSYKLPEGLNQRTGNEAENEITGEVQEVIHNTQDGVEKYTRYLNILFLNFHDNERIISTLIERGFLEQEDVFGNVLFIYTGNGEKKAAIFLKQHDKFLRFGKEKDVVVDRVIEVLDRADCSVYIALRNGKWEVHFLSRGGSIELLADHFQSENQARDASELLFLNKMLSMESSHEAKHQIFRENDFREEEIGPMDTFFLFTRKTNLGMQKVLCRQNGDLVDFSGSYFADEIELFTRQQEGVRGAIILRQGKYYYYKFDPLPQAINNEQGVETREEIYRLIHRLYGIF